MTDVDRSQQRSRWTLALVSLNFAMFLVLFIGLGFFVWRSLALISRLETNLLEVERQVAQVQKRVRALDIDSVMGDLIENAKQSMGKSIQATLEQANFNSSVQQMAQRIDNTQARIEQVSESVRSMNARLQKIDAEHLAQRVSYSILKNLGDGFTNAAESRQQAEEGRQLKGEATGPGSVPPR